VTWAVSHRTERILSLVQCSSLELKEDFVEVISNHSTGSKNKHIKLSGSSKTHADCVFTFRCHVTMFPGLRHADCVLQSTHVNDFQRTDNVISATEAATVWYCPRIRLFWCPVSGHMFQNSKPTTLHAS